MTVDQTLKLAEASLDELKAESVRVLNVADLTTIADYMIIASGRSARHVQRLGETLIARAKHAGLKPGVEGLREAEWVLIDLQGVVVHIMQPTARTRYQLEKLWDIDTRASEHG